MISNRIQIIDRNQREFKQSDEWNQQDNRGYEKESNKNIEILKKIKLLS
jgi:hypothetical protein